MRSVSHLALGLMLGVAGMAMTVAPAAAAKKEKKAEEPKRNYSQKFVAAAQPLQKALNAKDYAAAATALQATEAAVANADDKYLLGNFRLQLGLGTNDAAMQRAAIKEILASGAVGADEQAKFNFFAGKMALDAKAYDEAIPYLQQAATANYDGSASSLLLAEAQFQKAIGLSADAKGQLSPAAKPVAIAGLPALKRAIEIEKAAGRAVPAAWYNRGFIMSYLSGSPDSAEWAKLNLASDPSSKNWRTLLRSYQDSHPQLTRGESLDLMRLMYETGSLESEFDFAEYVDAASKSGLLGEVKAVIDQGRSRGKLAPTKLADYYTQAAGGIDKDRASLPAAEGSAAKAANGRLAVNTGDAYLGYGNYAKAASLYQLALQKGGVDAGEINTRLGIALAKSGDAAGARTAFQQVTTGARKDIAQYWLLWLDNKPAA